MDNEPCSRALCGKAALERCGGCKSHFYCSKECQRAAWREGHRFECRALADAYAAVEGADLFALAPGDAAAHAPLPASDTTKVYLTGLSAGLPRLTARFFAGSVRKSAALVRRAVSGGAMDADSLRKTLLALRRHQDVLDAPESPAAYQEAIGGMVDALERWHCLRLALRGLAIPWMTLEDGEADEVGNREAARRAAAGDGSGSVAYAGIGARMPELTWMG